MESKKLSKIVEELEFKILSTDSQILLHGGAKDKKETKNNCATNCASCNEKPKKIEEKQDTVIPNNCKGGNCVASPK